jgi:hypothetical protein
VSSHPGHHVPSLPNEHAEALVKTIADGIPASDRQLLNGISVSPRIADFLALKRMSA